MTHVSHPAQAPRGAEATSRGRKAGRFIRLAMLAAAALIVAVGAATLSAAGPGPKIQFDEYEWDFGDMYQQEEKSHTFVFTNTGDADLIIHKTRTSCGCTAAMASEGPIAPGAKGEIKVTYASKTAHGAASKTVTIQSNAPDSVTTVVVKANVKMEVDVPKSVQFGNVERDKPVEQVIDVTAEKGLPFQVVKVESDAPYITASFELATSKATEGPKYKVKVSLSPDAPPGAVNNRLRIYTNMEKKPVIEVPIYAKVMGRLRISPESVNFGSFAPGAAQEVVVTLSAPDNHPIQITGVRCSSPDVVATLKTLADGKSYEVHCTVADAKQTGRISSKLIIETSDPTEARREVLMVGFVKS